MLLANVDNQLPSGTATAVLPEVDALPRAKGELLAEDRNRQRGRGERGLDVRRHVVGALRVVLVEGIAFRDEALQPALEVALRRRVGVLLDHEAGGGVAQEERAQALAD